MQLLKVSDGLLEVENFYLTSPFPDFLGEGATHRDSTTFYIDANTKIERNINYLEFLIEIEKENWSNIDKLDMFEFYVGYNDDMYGIKDDLICHQCQYQKIIYNDKYLQCYASDNNKDWVNLGGLHLDNIDKQGFEKKSANSLVIKKYRVYKNPYLTIQNFDENTRVEVYDTLGNKIKERLFDSNRLCQIFLDNCFDGKLKFYDTSNNLIHESAIMFLQYGDVYYLNPYELELIYEGIVLDNTNNPTCLYSFKETVILKNKSISKAYNDFKISTTTNFDDVILLSLDDVSYTSDVVISRISPNEEVKIYVQITKGVTNHNFECRDFDLLVTKI